MSASSGNDFGNGSQRKRVVLLNANIKATINRSTRFHCTNPMLKLRIKEAYSKSVSSTIKCDKNFIAIVIY